MNSTDLTTFNWAVQLAQNGQKAEAYNQLVALAKTNGNNNDPQLLLWAAFTAPTLKESGQLIDLAGRIDPANSGLAGARSWLETELAKQPAPPPAYLESRPPYEVTTPQPQPAPAPYFQPQPQPYQQPYVQPQPPAIQQNSVVVVQQAAVMAGPIQCPYCHTSIPPRIIRRTSTAGWIVFTVLLFTTLIFCFIGLAMKEEVRVCSHCGARL